MLPYRFWSLRFLDLLMVTALPPCCVYQTPSLIADLDVGGM